MQKTTGTRNKNELIRNDLLKFFAELANPDPDCIGLERFLSLNGEREVFERFERKNDLNLNKVQLNQLFLISGLPSITFGFFKYYWLKCPEDTHPYDVLRLEEADKKTEKRSKPNSGDLTLSDFDPEFFTDSDEDSHSESRSVIPTWNHFRWGLRRIYADCLLYFGNITLGFTELGSKTEAQLHDFFKTKCFDTKLVRDRGHSLNFIEIPDNDRYLISEMACKNHEAGRDGISIFNERLLNRFFEAKASKIDRVKVGVLLSKEKITKSNALIDVSKKVKTDVTFLAADLAIAGSDILDEVIDSVEKIGKVLTPLVNRWNAAREMALQNTRLYLSLVNDMDVYVATSMRTKEDFTAMAMNCKKIFKGFTKETKLDLRYFDPTMSAAEGHEDKGIIECLMVKCAKVLIYTSGDKDSYGKDAEAAMALSSGKPVIFFCDQETRTKLFKDVHPLSKLIDFKTGVANGAMIASRTEEVIELLVKLFHNRMAYRLERELETHKKKQKAYFRLIDRITGSTVRIQTSDLFLSTGFWGYFHNHVKGR